MTFHEVLQKENSKMNQFKVKQK